MAGTSRERDSALKPGAGAVAAGTGERKRLHEREELLVRLAAATVGGRMRESLA